MYEIVVGRSESDKKTLGLKGTVFLGKHYVRMGPTTSLSNKIFMDVTKSHVILVSGKRGCLTPNTKILTDSGYKEISKFDKLKDNVITYNIKNKKFEHSNAALLNYKINEPIIKLTLEDDSIIEGTKEHPLMTIEDKILKWKNMSELRCGEVLFGKDKEKKIKNIEEINSIGEVYDLSVPITHSFVAEGIVSHNSGKSYLMGVIAEEMAHLPEEVKNKIAVLMFDTMGIFWTMRYENLKDEELLEEWDLQKKSLDINIYVPSGYFKEYKEKGIPADYSFTLNPSELNTADWCSTFEISPLDPIGILIENTLAEVKRRFENYDIEDITTVLSNKKADEKTKSALESLFSAAKSWGIFSKDATKLKGLFEGGKVSVLDISAYKEWNVKNLVIGLVCKKLMEERVIARKKEELEDVQKGHSYFETTSEETGRDVPLVWILLDEAHISLPKDKKTPATDSLVTILREGRQPGISLILATQQPGEIHKDVITQTDIIISLLVTARRDLNALNEMMQSYLTGEIQKYFNMLPKLRGAAIILDDNSEKIYPIQIRPRFTWHGGESPTALKPKGSAAEQLGL